MADDDQAAEVDDPGHQEDHDHPRYAVLACPSCNSAGITDALPYNGAIECPTCGHSAPVDAYTVLLETPDAHEARQAQEQHDQHREPPGIPGTTRPSPPSTSTDGRLTDGPDYTVELPDTPRLAPDWPVDAEPDGFTIKPTNWFHAETATLYEDVPPQRQEWLQGVLGDLAPIAAKLVRDIAAETSTKPFGGEDLSLFVRNVLEETVTKTADAETTSTVAAEVRAYLEAVTRYAFLFNDPEYLSGRTVWGDAYIKNVERILERAGTSLGQFNAGIEALRLGPLRLLAQADDKPTLVFQLDAEEWVEGADDTIRRSLEAFHALTAAADVQIEASPETLSRLTQVASQAVRNADQRPPAWAERLTQTGDSSGDTGSLALDVDAGQEDADVWEAYELLCHETKSGQHALINNLYGDFDRTIKEVKADSAIDLRPGTIGRYIPELEALGLVETEHVAAGSNHVRLTPLGVEAKALITPDQSVIHPTQSRLSEAGYADLPAECKDSVTRQPSKRGVVERQLAATGDPATAGYVQWLGESSGERRVQPTAMHDRILAGARVNGVNLVEDEILDWSDSDQAPEGDGRVTYLSAFNDDVVVATQWGGPAATLARLTSALLSDQAWSKILTDAALGEQFEKAFGGAADFENSLGDILRRGVQVGWLSEDELQDKEKFKDRVTAVRDELLSKLAEFEELDSGLRSQWFRDVHGLLTSTIALYRSVGLQVNINLRLPNARHLARDDERLEDFLTFLQKTVTKQAGFEDENGWHSIFRLLMEKRESKLRARLPYDVKKGEDTADLMANWIIQGFGVESLQGEIEAALAAERDRVRDQVRLGSETAPALDIPVAPASTKMNMRRIIREYSRQKGFDGADVDELTRVLNAYLRDESRGRGPVPMDVADVLMALEQKDSAGDTLSVENLGVGLAAVPTSKLLPELPPSATRMLKALLESSSSLSRAELEEVTSERSVQRHLEKLLGTSLVEAVGDKGYTAFVEPWWATDSTRPRNDEHEAVYRDSWASQQIERWPTAVAHVFYDVPGVYESVPGVTGTDLFAHPVDVDEVKRKWRAYGWFVDFARLLLDGPPPGEESERRVVIGSTPGMRPANQAPLPAGVSG